ncbi:MAG: gamma-glutamyltransferase [Gammaproteobacteria bacterium]|tara:strand:- start:13510 stop:15204 length:1695 start_codon:yes stop_codon:yes gene_type:complete
MVRGILKISQISKIYISKYPLIAFLLILLFFYSSLVKAESYAVASRHHLATDIGMRVLNEGGNAIDAAVAVGFALAVVNPSAGNLGGGGFMLIHLAETNETISIDYRERAPAKSYEKMFQDNSGKVIKGLSLNSILASGVPGTISGMFYASEKYGTVNIKELINPSIELARKGFLLSAFQAKNLNKYKKKFSKNKEAKKIFTRPNGFSEGDNLVQINLGNTLRKISINGKDEFYSGDTAKKISDFFQRNEGILSLKDLNEYKIRVIKPVCGKYRDYKICSMAPPSSGGIALIQMLNILENFNLNKFDHNSEEYLRLLITTMDYAYKDRAMYLGDPDFFEVPQDLLISKNYANKIYQQIQEKKPPTKADVNIIEGEETTHFSIIDKWGNAVSNTYTLNTAYGSGIIPSGTGILMNNEMDDFSSKPGYPNAYGLVGSKANKIEPKKTPLSSMSPVIVFQNNKPFLITGSPGGSTIITSVLQEILNVLDFKMSLEESSKKSRIHFQHLPDILFHENLKNNLVQSLKTNKKLINRKLGEIHSILLKKDSLEAFSDKRRPDGKASSFQK